MYIVYLESSLNDLEWVRFYYKNIFPSGKKQATSHIKASEKLISEHPNIGEVYDSTKNIKELAINKTPFSFIYRVKKDRIEILRLWDQRGDRNNLIM
ncbi:type II toxin-antitoxin system RelE/ParE family toxin [Methyloprofundus sp.]|uniref:type II toxin-antitoxin system RelE/ParE family toxin n=1 Tax=Methyloprofundus sp. TaxID=2020875 RepID=UPI003D1244A4